MPGSIEKRGKNSWRIIIPDGYEPNGKKRRITESVKFSDTMTEAQQRKECEKIKALLYSKAKAGQVVSSGQYTLQEYAEMWLEEYPPTAGLSLVTVDGYRRLLNGRIIPSLGRIKLHQLSAQQVTRFYREMLTEDGQGNRGKGKKLSASTVLHYHRLLRAMLNVAVKWGIIAHNPVLNATIPKNDTPPMRAYTPEETTALLAALEQSTKTSRIARSDKPASAILRANESKGIGDGKREQVGRANAFLPQGRLDLRPELLNRRQIRAIGRKV